MEGRSDESPGTLSFPCPGRRGQGWWGSGGGGQWTVEGRVSFLSSARHPYRSPGGMHTGPAEDGSEFRGLVGREAESAVVMSEGGHVRLASRTKCSANLL